MNRLWTALCLSILVFAAGCHSGSSQSSANSRVLHASLDSETFDVLVDSNAKVSGVAFGAATGYSDSGSGSHTVTIRSSSSGTTLLSKTISFASGANQTLVVYGKRAALGTVLLVDDVTDPAAGNFKVRVVGLSPDVGTVDVYLTSGGIASAPATITNVGYSVITDYSEIGSGTFTITITPAGTKEILFQSSPQNFAAGSKNTIAVYPAYSGKLVNAELLTAGTNASGTLFLNTNARVKSANAVPDSTQLNFLADAITIFANVPYKGTSSYVVVSAGNHTMQVQSSAVPGTSIASLPVKLDPARDYSVLAVNTLAQPQLVALVDDNTLPTSGYAKVRFVNARAAGGNADAFVDFASQATGIATGAASGYVQILAGDTYTVTFTTPGGVNAIATLNPVQFLPGAIYSMYLFGTGTTGEIRLARDR
jgi:hypothetical protein